MPERFEEADTPSYAIQSAIHKYLFASKYSENKSVLDVACGIGYGSNIIKNNTKSCHVIGGDNYFKGIKFGNETYNKNIDFCNLSAIFLPFKDSSLDMVISFETFEHLKDLNKFLEEIRRTLKDGGLLICSTPNRVWSERVGIKNEFHLKEYTHDELESILNKYFKEIKSYGQIETASEILYRLPFIFKVYRLLRPMLAKIFRVRNPNVVSTKSLNPRFSVKEFWPTSPYLIFVARK